MSPLRLHIILLIFIGFSSPAISTHSRSAQDTSSFFDINFQMAWETTCVVKQIELENFRKVVLAPLEAALRTDMQRATQQRKTLTTFSKPSFDFYKSSIWGALKELSRNNLLSPTHKGDFQHFHPFAIAGKQALYDIYINSKDLSKAMIILERAYTRDLQKAAKAHLCAAVTKRKKAYIYTGEERVNFARDGKTLISFLKRLGIEKTHDFYKFSEQTYERAPLTLTHLETALYAFFDTLRNLRFSTLDGQDVNKLYNDLKLALEIALLNKSLFELRGFSNTFKIDAQDLLEILEHLLNPEHKSLYDSLHLAAWRTYNAYPFFMNVCCTTDQLLDDLQKECEELAFRGHSPESEREAYRLFYAGYQVLKQDWGENKLHSHFQVGFFFFMKALRLQFRKAVIQKKRFNTQGHSIKFQDAGDSLLLYYKAFMENRAPDDPLKLYERELKDMLIGFIYIAFSASPSSIDNEPDWWTTGLEDIMLVSASKLKKTLPTIEEENEINIHGISDWESDDDTDEESSDETEEEPDEDEEDDGQPPRKRGPGHKRSAIRLLSITPSWEDELKKLNIMRPKNKPIIEDAVLKPKKSHRRQTSLGKRKFDSDQALPSAGL